MLLPVFEYVVELQGRQTELPTVGLKKPTEQLEQTIWSANAVYVPTGQATQERAALLTYVPGIQAQRQSMKL